MTDIAESYQITTPSFIFKYSNSDPKIVRLEYTLTDNSTIKFSPSLCNLTHFFLCNASSLVHLKVFQKIFLLVLFSSIIVLRANDNFRTKNV